MICSIIATIALSCGENTLLNQGFYNALLNRRITPTIHSDRLIDKNKLHDMFWQKGKQYGLQKELRGQDYWSERLDNISYHDCEDYALNIRLSLMELGYKTGYLALIEDYRRKQKHIVLIVPTKQGYHVIDTNYPNKLRSLQDFKIHMERHDQALTKVLTDNKWKEVHEKIY